MGEIRSSLAAIVLLLPVCQMVSKYRSYKGRYLFLLELFGNSSAKYLDSYHNYLQVQTLYRAIVVFILVNTTLDNHIESEPKTRSHQNEIRSQRNRPSEPCANGAHTKEITVLPALFVSGESSANRRFS